MKTYVFIFLTVIVSSMYLFPFEFSFLPRMNTKMLLGGLGLIILTIQLAKKRNALIDRNMFTLSVIAILISLTALFSVTFNATAETSYITYIVSMWVWVSGAYTVVTFIRKVHGYVSVRIVCNYLIAVCVIQCALALMIDAWPILKETVNNSIGRFGGMGTASRMDERNRLYGIGAALDIAGSRFSAVLFMITYLCVRYQKELSKTRLLFYIFSFLIIALVGNMISRTTTIGLLLSVVYFIYVSRSQVCYLIDKDARLWKYVTGGLVVFLVAVTVIYNRDAQMHTNIRFAFEGFFSLVEEGRWDVGSNKMLANMYVFPETLKTWLIGDGYFENPTSDPTYTGYMWKGFYQGTDVGYLRFIFFFGMIGLGLFIAFMCKVCTNCMKKFAEQKFLFAMLLVINFIVWFKVSTDIFLIFALFLCIGEDENREVTSQL